MKIFRNQSYRRVIFLVLSITTVLYSCRTHEKQIVNDVDELFGLVNVSVCNIRSSPAHSAELITQALMGTPVKIIKTQAGWYFLITPESYEGWVDKGAIGKMNTREFEEWKGSDRIICLAKYGEIYADTGSMRIISDFVAGSIIKVSIIGNGYYHVVLPDGRKGYLDKNNATVFKQWMLTISPEEENLKTLAESFTGIPYLWGGTSVKSFDCSGFVKTVYYLNGVILKRDASQQFKHGIKLEKNAYPDSLRTGDLLFFGFIKDGAPHPTHVGMYIGNTEFIHASGMVKVNSLDSTMINFSRGRKDTFLGVRRIIGADPDDGIQYISGHSWYN